MARMMREPKKGSDGVAALFRVRLLRLPAATSTATAAVVVTGPTAIGRLA